MQTSLHILICLSGKMFSCTEQCIYTPGRSENVTNGVWSLMNIVGITSTAFILSKATFISVHYVNTTYYVNTTTKSVHYTAYVPNKGCFIKPCWMGLYTFISATSLMCWFIYFYYHSWLFIPVLVHDWLLMLVWSQYVIIFCLHTALQSRQILGSAWYRW